MPPRRRGTAATPRGAAQSIGRASPDEEWVVVGAYYCIGAHRPRTRIDWVWRWLPAPPARRPRTEPLRRPTGGRASGGGVRRDPLGHAARGGARGLHQQRRVLGRQFLEAP